MPFRLVANPRYGGSPTEPLSHRGFLRTKNEITSWHGYEPTSLRELSALAEGAGVQCIRLKDEAQRFGLGSFKAFGGAYTVAEVLPAELVRRAAAPEVRSVELDSDEYSHATGSMVVTCATDGNTSRWLDIGTKIADQHIPLTQSKTQ